ncbi:MAG: sialate O-acetylesterase, partial [Phycisphaeraceae bacterium]|nr:sialate O-acetylesterase [Phycisphaeraceae bacterium]
MRTCRLVTVLMITLCAGLGSTWADVTLPAIFSDHMVLQRNADIRVWGWADAGEKVSVTLGQDTQATTANPSGQWQVTLDARAAGAPMAMTVAGNNTVT